MIMLGCERLDCSDALRGRPALGIGGVMSRIVFLCGYSRHRSKEAR
jgi:hypothetical protein